MRKSGVIARKKRKGSRNGTIPSVLFLPRKTNKSCGAAKHVF
jgi:hypothetical protein